MLISLLVGFVVALVLVLAGRAISPATFQRASAVGLVVAAIIYAAFAIVRDAGAHAIAVELAGVVVYGFLAWFGLRKWPLALAIGWCAHAVWDFALHLHGSLAAYTPWWYPWACASFDLVIALALLSMARRSREPNPL